MNDTKTKPFHTVSSPVEICESRVRDLLVTAFEGGSNYWIESINHKVAEGLTYEDFKEGGKLEIPGDYFPGYILVPFHEGCSLEIKAEDDDKTYCLDAAKMKQGLELMAKNEQRHWQDFINENDDAETADVFLQLCLFNEIVYG